MKTKKLNYSSFDIILNLGDFKVPYKKGFIERYNFPTYKGYSIVQSDELQELKSAQNNWDKQLEVMTDFASIEDDIDNDEGVFAIEVEGYLPLTEYFKIGFMDLNAQQWLDFLPYNKNGFHAKLVNLKIGLIKNILWKPEYITAWLSKKDISVMTDYRNLLQTNFKHFLKVFENDYLQFSKVIPNDIKSMFVANYYQQVDKLLKFEFKFFERKDTDILNLVNFRITKRL